MTPRAAPAPAGAVADRRARLRPRESGWALGLLALTAWVAQFHRFAHLGLYEDDYFFISQAMGQDPSYLLARLKVFTGWSQGRPIGFFLPDLLSFIGDKLGGLPAIYLIGFAIVTLNSFLCFTLLRRRLPPPVALAGALFFGLFPADTTKMLLTHDFQLQPSLTFLLLASLLYTAGRRKSAYLVSVGSLLSYESAFMVFFGVPLLARRWDRRTVPELLRHSLVLAGILAAGVAVRLLVGEGRAVSSTGSLLTIAPLVVGSLVLGPARSGLLFFYGPLRSLPSWELSTILLVAMAGVALFWVFRRLGAGGPGPRLALPGFRATLLGSEGLQLLLAGVVLLGLGYALAFTHFPPTAATGRGTSVHLGATVGASVIFASLAWALLASRRRGLGAAVLAGYLALAVGYQITIQRDFERSWQLQRAFWSQVVACCSDLRDGTVLLFEVDGPPPTSYIFTNSWADPLVLRQLFRFPASWRNPPRLFSLADWRSRVQADGDRLRWWVPGASWDEHWEELPAGNVILLRQVEGRLVRREGSVQVAGRPLALKEEGPSERDAWGRGPLYGYLLARPGA